MRQLLQNLKSGLLEIAEVPAPGVSAGHVLIRTTHSLISSGTERMLQDFARAGWIEKAMKQPDKVRQVLDKARTDGVMAAYEAVQSRLEEPLPLGYCNSGVVLETGAGVTSCSPGDRVASNGAHAEVVSVPERLTCRVPEGVSSAEASATVIASIALHGVRLVEPTLGETIIVQGLGLVGLMAAQLLKASGCRVIGIEPSSHRARLAGQLGIEAMAPMPTDQIVAAIAGRSGGRLADGVLIAASTESNSLIEQAAAMCRKRGRVVLVGVVGLSLPRAVFYEKEIRFQVSCSYGPGRYDPAYEEQGTDYPLAYVRWTEQRNFEAVLGAIGSGGLKIAPLISDTFRLERAGEAYERLRGGGDALGILLEYDAAREGATDRTLQLRSPKPEGAAVPAASVPQGVAFIGAGRFARGTLIPAFRAAGAQLEWISSSSGSSSGVAARQFGFRTASTDWRGALNAPDVGVAVIATPHALHAPMAAAFLESGKHVFVEKPLAIGLAGLAQVCAARRSASPGQHLMVGFNRRFSPLALDMKRLLAARQGPAAVLSTINAGFIPKDHWSQDPAVGGGRIVGEACHWLDLMEHLVGSSWTDLRASCFSGVDGEDKMTIVLRYEDGSQGTLHYLANGHKSFSKERIEVFFDGRILALDNFVSLRGYGVSGFSRRWLWKQDKGHAAEVTEFLERAREGREPAIGFESLISTTLASLAAVESAKSDRLVTRHEMEERLESAIVSGAGAGR
ncbi:MAG: bi-domain-containing oxidoreductase [Candidatus Wallbacteria bacterium]|nr:bi-domain-containing oxidoreductase [Candidatus Wallbacteria bacterium]